MKAVATAEVAGAATLWQEIVDASPDAWLWHTWTALQFNLSAGQKFEAKDHSFFVYKDEQLVGVVPLVIQKRSVVDSEGLDAMYYSGFLPWPCFCGNLTAPERELLEDFAFKELERRARATGVGHIRLRFTPPSDEGDEGKRIERVTLAHRYLGSSSSFQTVRIDADTLSRVRERYQRYYKKYVPLFDLSVAEKGSVTPELEETYFQLHVKDAGGQSRSRESYSRQADIARNGEGFYVVATEKKSDTVVGMLLISLYHGAALDNSLAVDPSFQGKRIGHLLKWRAIEELMRRGVTTYEVGHQKINIPNFERLVIKKDLGISEFKEGWARGNERTRWEIEKFLDAKFLRAYLASRENALREYFDV